jgi:hypothetical protein
MTGDEGRDLACNCMAAPGKSSAMIEIEISGRFLLDDVPEYDAPQVDVALASGLGGERLIRIAIGATKFVVQAKRVALQMLNYDRITGVKITRDGVEIGSMRSQDGEQLKQLVADVLDHLQKAPAKAKGPPKNR